MENLITLGSVLFWILLSALVIAIIYFLDDALSFEDRNYRRDNGGGFGSTICLTLFVLLCYFCGLKDEVLNVINFVQNNFFNSIIWYVLTYIIIGIVWSIVKWYFFLINLRDYYENNHIVMASAYIPKAKDNRFRIISWMSYWPFSLTWTLITEPVKKLYTYIYNRLGKVYDRMVERIFPNINSGSTPE